MTTCSACGTEQPASFRFCGACGEALGGSGAGEVRKTVTVLFCDMVGSTALGERTDPEVLRETMRRYHATCRAVLERHGATVEKFVGDAAMAVFGIPRVHEDDPLRAVRAAVEMRDAVRALGIETRIGVNTGPVVTGRGETLVTGDAVNVAARLEQAATAGEILIGGVTAELAGAAVHVDPVEPLALKGKRAPVAAFRVRALTGSEPQARGASGAPFVGRAAELAALAGAAAAAQGGTPQLATLVGPPGIGKTRLAREALRRSASRVLTGRCLSYGAGITYWPLAEIVRQVGDVREALGETPDADLAAARVGVALGASGSATPEDIAWGVRRLFESLAREGPVTVVFDDIHWAEPTLLDLIEYVATFARDVPLFILCTARPELFERRAAWATPKANAMTLTLEPLAGEESVSLVEGLGTLSVERRARIVEAAEGNPLFVEQLVAMQREHGDEVLAIPLTLQALLAARIDGLEPQERAVLERGSIEGRTFHRGAVAQLLPEADRGSVGAQLLTLVRKSLVRPDQAQVAGDDGFRFGHVLIRDAAYEAIPKRQRSDLHERFADWLAARLGGNAPPEIVGYHLEQAYRYREELGAPDAAIGGRAAEQLARAADAATVRGDVRAAGAFYTRAAALLAEDDPARPRLLLGQGEALREGTAGGAGQDALEAAVSTARAVGDTHVEWRARLLLASMRAWRELERGAAPALSEAHAAIAIAADRGDDVLAAWAWDLVCDVAMIRGRLAERLEAVEAGLRHARAAADRQLEARLVIRSAPALLFGPTPVAEGLRIVDEAFARVGDVPVAQSFAAHVNGHLRARIGDHATARTEIAAWRDRMHELGRESMYVSAATCLYEVHSLAGDWAAAEAAVREGYAVLERRGDKLQMSTMAALIGEACMHQGRIDEAERYARLSAESGARDDEYNEVYWRTVLAQVLTRRGKRDEAVELAREAVALADGMEYVEHRGWTRLALAEALGPGDEAARAAAEAMDIYERKGNLVMRDQASEMLQRSR